MKNKYISLVLALLLVGCSTTNNNSFTSENAFYNKIESNEDFGVPGNMVRSDFEIDGILDNEEWNTPNLEINFGGTNTVPATVNAKLYFGENGLTVGFVTKDTMISASQEYNNDQFVVNSDNVEFYIDCLNDKGQIAKPDDYTFLINPEEYAEMRVGTGSYWGPWSGVVDYAVKVDGTINDDSDIDVGWGCELFLPYKTFGFSKDSEIGIAFGCRDKTTNLKTSEWSGWIPDPQIIDTYVSITKDGIVKNSAGNYNIASGNYSYDAQNDIYTSESSNSLAVHKSDEMRNGTYSADMYLNKIDGDNGIIFQVKESETGLFWEGTGVRYYFFFINLHGEALLAKTNNGLWTHIKNVSCSLKVQDWNNLKVVVNNNKITCFLNGIKVIEHTEALYSTIGVGLRSGVSGVKYKNIQVSDSLDVTETGPKIEGYQTVKGFFDYHNVEKTQIKANVVAPGAMLVKENTTISNGTIKLKLKANSKADNGITFRINDNGNTSYWEEGVSYYFFFISLNGTAYLGRVNNGWSNLGENSIVNYDVNKEYELKVVMNGDNIKCYVDNTLYLDVNDSTVKGTKCGIRAGSTNAIFSLLTAESA